MIIYRPHRGSLNRAMEEAREFDSMDDILNWICKEHNDLMPEFQITPKEIYIEEYCKDERVGWHNCFLCCFERPSKIKNFESYCKYLGLNEKDVTIIDDEPCGVLGMFSTDYNKNILKEN